MFSLRTHHDPRPNALAVALERHRAAGLPLLDLTQSNPTRAGLPYAAAGVCAALADPRWLAYAPDPLGQLPAREAVAQMLDVAGVAPEHVVLTASTSEAYAYLFKLVADPGDDVLVPAPSYPLLAHLAALEGVRLSPYRLAYDGEWHVDAASLRAAAGPRSRAVVVVNPNNPTGNFAKSAEAEALRGLGLPVISDEVFAAYPLEAAPGALPTLLGAPALQVFALGGLSKLCGFPQVKLAWIAVSGPAPWRAGAMDRLELVADTFLSPGTPVQVALPGLLRAGAATREAIRARTAGNLGALRRALAGSAVSVLKAEGGWSAVVRLPRSRTDLEWALLLLEADDVAVHPGYFFDMEDRAALVVSLLTPEPDFAEAAVRLRRRVEAAA